MPSLFIGIYTAIYDYEAQNTDQISFKEGDILCILEKPADDDWWRAKKKGDSLDDDEPTGLIPSNYIEESTPIGTYKALYDYEQQTEEEISFSEDATLQVYDNSDTDWTLVGYNGSFGYAPANYIEKADEGSSEVAPDSAPVPAPVQTPAVKLPAPVTREVRFEEPTPAEPPRPPRQPTPPSEPPSPALPVRQPSRGPETSAPSLSESRATPSPGLASNHSRPDRDSKPPRSAQPIRTVHHFSDSDSDDDGPSLPNRRPRGELDHHAPASPRIPPGYRTYPVQEVDSKKKRAAMLGLGPDSFILLPDKSTRPMEEWSIEALTNYSNEGKHVFLEFSKPARSLDLHAGSTDAAYEIIGAVGEMRGAMRAAGLDEVVAAATGGLKKNIGTILYEFKAQGDDEVSVLPGDEVQILDDTAPEWWLVRRQVNGMEGVVPSSYVERGRKNIPITAGAGIRESPGVPRKTASKDTSADGVPERRSSLPPQASGQSRKSVQAKAKPDVSQVRTWTDRTGTFKVDAQFLVCRDGKIHLHKLNGVKIAVPVSKMSIEDIQYVERKTGISLDEEKPLSEIMKEQRRRSQQAPQAGIVIDKSSTHDRSRIQSPGKSNYDWFDFFLTCGVDVNDCQRYALAFERENMDESVLADITTDILSNLGLKTGDQLRVKKKLEQKFGGAEKSPNAAGGLFSEPGGILKGRSRPAPAVQTGAVDLKAFSQQEKKPENSPSSTPAASSNSPKPGQAGFDDNAWEVKPSKVETAKAQTDPVSTPVEAPKPAPTSTPTLAPAPSPTPAPVLTGALKDMASLSLDTPPLQPVKAPQAPVQSTNSQTVYGQNGSLGGASFGTDFANTAARARPTAPQLPQNTGPLGIPPPPTARSASVPTTMSPPPPLVPNYTGMPFANPQFSMPTGQYPMGQPQISPAMTGMGYGMPMQTPSIPMQLTGFVPPQFQYPQATGMSMGPQMNIPSFGMQPQMPMIPIPTGQPSTLGINSILPPPLVPQPTAAPLRPQPTGPPPPVKFGVQAQKLKPQPTGKADLSKATPDNPFGF